ncbi:hypothetical protein [Aquimarina mytili]|uniref:Antibiotic biosynthesis monooxygenase n=1 Tax=Aquimarina mytili TaxID=874423 RepID=A0A936ZVY1_9FLAO|nr:hypothetical protein [Aquimarina mytili]MBL0682980.1 hypothetical protein [Aquimarina mytili]
MNTLILIIMVNLLFNPSAKPNQNFLSMKNKSTVVEVVLFETNQGYSEEEAQKALTSLNDIVKLHYGFIERTTASNGDGKYIDIVYWTDMKSAKTAAADIMKNQKALAIFNVIKPESIQMYHFDTFNHFEE